MLQSEVASRVKSNLNDAGATFFTVENIDQAIQDGYDTSVNLLLPLVGSKSVTLVSNLVYYDLYNTIQDYLHVLAVYNNTTDNWLDFKTIKWLESQRETWELTEGQPEVFTVLDYRYVALWPTLTAATGTLDIFFKKRGKQLISTDSIDILDIEPDLVEWFATMDGLEQVEEFEKAIIYFRQFVESIRVGQNLIAGRSRKDLVSQYLMKGTS